MWILTPSITSAFAAATGASTSASSEQLASACAQSLLWRSSASPPATWQRRLKQNSWTTHLSGAICEPSLGESFTDWWTSFLAAIRASHSAPPANASAPKTQDTSGRTYQPELLQCDQVPVSLKTSRDISALGFPTCCKTWQEWVTERRGAYSARLKLARLTRGKESSSWPTISVNESKNSVGKSQEHRNSIPLGTMAAMQSWPTPNAQVSQDGESPETWLKRKEAMKAKGYNGNGCGTPLTIAVQLHGQAAPASSSSLGSRQELWPTPSADGDSRPGANADPVKWQEIADAKKAQGINKQLFLTTKVAMEEAKKQELWLTPKANESDSDPNFAARNADRGAHCHGTLSSQAKSEEFPTPRTTDWKSTANAPSNPQRVEDGTATLGEFVHAKQWATPKASDPQHSGPNMRDSAGNYALPAQVTKSWLTPKVPSGGSQAERTTAGGGLRKLEDQTQTPTGKLNSQWVTQLMGLSLGWVSPSCPASVIKNWPRFVSGWSALTIAPMSCDSSAMELCLPPQSELSEFSLAS